MITIDPIRKIDSRTIIKYSGGFTVPLPDPFIESNELQPRDEMEIYRDLVNGRDALILIPKKSVKNNGFSEGSNNNGETESPEGAIKKVL